MTNSLTTRAERVLNNSLCNVDIVSGGFVSLCDLIRNLANDSHPSVASHVLQEISNSSEFVRSLCNGQFNCGAVVPHTLFLTIVGQESDSLSHRFPGLEHLLLAATSYEFKSHFFACEEKWETARQMIRQEVYFVLGQSPTPPTS